MHELSYLEAKKFWSNFTDRGKLTKIFTDRGPYLKKTRIFFASKYDNSYTIR
jgi:hypothetical protein